MYVNVHEDGSWCKSVKVYKCVYIYDIYFEILNIFQLIYNYLF